METEGHITHAQIIELNRRLQLPRQPIDMTIYNGALNKLASTLPFNLPRIAQHGPNGKILPIEWTTQRVMIHAYSNGLGPANSHIATLNLATPLNMPYITVDSMEQNRTGFWIHVIRTVHLHGTRPIVSLDMVALSHPPTRVIPGARPPECFQQPADIGPPP